ncbi:MAG: hypothetical protein VW405_15305 [Rhodospirillaceae bacterium]
MLVDYDPARGHPDYPHAVHGYQVYAMQSPSRVAASDTPLIVQTSDGDLWCYVCLWFMERTIEEAERNGHDPDQLSIANHFWVNFKTTECRGGAEWKIGTC